MPKKMRNKDKTKINFGALTHDNVPATVGLVSAIRLEQQAEISALEHSLRAEIVGVSNKVESLEHSLRAEIVGVSNKVESIEHSLRAEIVGVSNKIESIEHSLRAEIVGVSNKVESMEKRGDQKFDAIDQKFDAIDQKLDAMDLKIQGQIQQVMASVHRTQILMEEQRGENKIVLDGILMVTSRLERLENRQAF